MPITYIPRRLEQYLLYVQITAVLLGEVFAHRVSLLLSSF